MSSRSLLAWYAVAVTIISSCQLCQVCLRGARPNVVEGLL
jgi:hypothetical protein